MLAGTQLLDWLKNRDTSLEGAVITKAGNDPNVAALVYIAGFAPD